MYIKKEVLEEVAKITDAQERAFVNAAIKDLNGFFVKDAKMVKGLERIYITGGRALYQNSLARYFKYDDKGNDARKMIQKGGVVEVKEEGKGMSLKSKMIKALSPEIGGNNAFNREKMQGEGRRVNSQRLAKKVEYNNVKEFKNLSDEEVKEEKRKMTLTKNNKGETIIDKKLKAINPKHKTGNYKLVPRIEYKKDQNGKYIIDENGRFIKVKKGEKGNYSVNDSSESTRKGEMWYNVYVNGIYTGYKVKYSSSKGRIGSLRKDEVEFEEE